MKRMLVRFSMLFAALLMLAGTALPADAGPLTGDSKPVDTSPLPADEGKGYEPDSGYKMTHSAATASLRASYITWSSSGNCSNRYNSTCTSFEQINSGTINGIKTLKSASGCAINITGGTETGHASGTYSHWNGYKVDISFNTCINNYIYNSFTYIGVRGDGAPMYRSAAGNIYARESSHWDILYY